MYIYKFTCQGFSCPPCSFQVDMAIVSWNRPWPAVLHNTNYCVIMWGGYKVAVDVSSTNLYRKYTCSSNKLLCSQMTWYSYKCVSNAWCNVTGAWWFVTNIPRRLEWQGGRHWATVWSHSILLVWSKESTWSSTSTSDKVCISHSSAGISQTEGRDVAVLLHNIKDFDNITVSLSLFTLHTTLSWI